MSFADHFSQLAQNYSRYRPHYPAALFAYLAAVAPGHGLAWDCGTGNGQAALQLANHFDRVVATDASSEQIARAFAHHRNAEVLGPQRELSAGRDLADVKGSVGAGGLETGVAMATIRSDWQSNKPDG